MPIIKLTCVSIACFASPQKWSISMNPESLPCIILASQGYFFLKCFSEKFENITERYHWLSPPDSIFISHFTSKKICNKFFFHGCCNILYKKYKSVLSSFVRKCILSCFYFSNTARNFQRTFSSSNSTMETPKRCLKSVQS